MEALVSHHDPHHDRQPAAQATPRPGVLAATPLRSIPLRDGFADGGR
jgi:hypothetical protein